MFSTEVSYILKNGASGSVETLLPIYGTTGHISDDRHLDETLHALSVSLRLVLTLHKTLTGISKAEELNKRNRQ